MTSYILPSINRSILLGLVIQTIVLLMVFALFSESAWAESMKCGTHIISDGLKPGPSKAQVKRKCGRPYLESGNHWVYYKGRSVYRLRFSEPSGLVSIRREIER